MDAASFPVAAKDMAALRGRDVGVPYRPSLAYPGGCRPGRVCAYHDRRRTFIKRSLCHEYHPAYPS